MKIEIKKPSELKAGDFLLTASGPAMCPHVIEASKILSIQHVEVKKGVFGWKESYSILYELRGCASDCKTFYPETLIPVIVEG